jgi:SAM-dependent methyltransferase
MKRSQQKEMMDLPGQPQELLAGDLRNLQIINHYLGGYRSVLCGLDRLVGGGKLNRFSLLDVGTGSGDIPARIIHWAQQHSIKASIVALEPEPVTARLAAILTQQANPPFIPPLQRLPSAVIPAKAGIQAGKEGDSPRCGISVVRGDAIAPPFRPASFDFVLASQLLHHFSEDKIVSLLRIWSKVARKAIIVSDLVRHPVAYHGISVITKLFTRNVMTRTDAPLSVQRAFTFAEWRDLFRCADIGPVQLLPVFPFRVLALLSLSGRT